jgi:hypothetical protein
MRTAISRRKRNSARLKSEAKQKEQKEQQQKKGASFRGKV